MKITLKQLEVFVAVARHGSATRAAELLDLSQSAASMALADLENQLGGRLFDRVGKRLQLNETGRLLQSKAMEVLARVAEIESMANGSVPRASLKIAASSTIGNYLAPRIIGDFMGRYPDSQISLDVGNTEHAVQRVLDFQADLGMIEGLCHSPEIEAMRWRSDELTIFAAPDHPLTRLSALTAQDLAQAKWILREQGSGTREIFEHAALPAFGSIHLSLELGHSEAIKQAVASGLGIGCLSQMALKPALEQGKLVALHTPFLNLRRDLYLLVHRDKYRTEGLERFLDLCRACFAEVAE
jgi:DNA-binding transcriptional LysR family regulator